MLKNTWFDARRRDGDFRRRIFARQPHQTAWRSRTRSRRRVYELRTYTAPEGKLGDLHARFRDHTMRIFNKHGMKSVAYFAPQDAPLSQNTLIYILEHPSREEAKKPGPSSGRSGMEEGVRRIAEGRPHRQQGRVGVHDADRLLADEVAMLRSMKEPVS